MVWQTSPSLGPTSDAGVRGIRIVRKRGALRMSGGSGLGPFAQPALESARPCRWCVGCRDDLIGLSEKRICWETGSRFPNSRLYTVHYSHASIKEL
jgi:hypothetical protein